MTIFARAFWVSIAAFLALNFGLLSVHAETRFALVIGNDQYKTARLATAANDAGLVADALQAAGFTVTGAANLDQVTLRQTLREFLDEVSAAGPDTVALVYLAGFGLQFNGENYFVPVDADVAHDVDIPLQTIRVADFAQPLAALPARVKIVILDAARQNPFARGDQPLASGLALVDAGPGMAVAFNAAPGTVGPEEPGPYGAYATALTEMIGAGGLSLDDIFARVRLRVSNLTQGAEIPWYVSQIDGPFFMTERAAGAPPPPNILPVVNIRNKPLRDFASVDDAYAAVLALDTIEGYEQFLSIYSYSPYSQRVAAMLAVRREEIVWRRCVIFDTPQAYWSYLRRYPKGPHSWDARRRLAILRAALDPPPQFALVDFGMPPPPPAELVFIDQPILIFAGPGWAPPPPPPVIFLPPRPREFAVLRPSPPPSGRFGLPMPSAAVVPVFVKPPPAVVVRPIPGTPAGPPGARPRVPVSLPNAVQHPSGTPGATPAIHTPPSAGAPAAPALRTPPAPGV
ncbi:MAG: caspase domain-containing protein, partial [Xanthobacteraceae bacterium]